MSTIAKSNTHSHDWENNLNQADTYVKDMISFFEEGWDARGVDDIKKKEGRIRVNVINSLTYIDQVQCALEELEIEAKATFLKGNSYLSHSVLFSIPIEDYIGENFLKVYPITSKIERASKSEDYSVNFTFTFDDGNLNEDSLSCDGYFKIHESKK